MQRATRSAAIIVQAAFTAASTSACASGDTDGAADTAPWTVESDDATSPAREVSRTAAHDVGRALARMAPLPRIITLRLEQCGVAAQAVWLVDAGEILLCDEIVEAVSAFTDAPVAAARFILAHELGHAAADLFAVPATGSGEDDADEFAAVFLLADDALRGDVRVAAAMMRRMALVPDLMEAARGERLARAVALECLADGASGPCGERYRRATERWTVPLDAAR